MGSHLRKLKRNADRRKLSQIFLGQDNEPLTEELIKSLAAQGMPEDDLRYAASIGGQYCRPRNSIIFPPETLEA